MALAPPRPVGQAVLGQVHGRTKHGQGMLQVVSRSPHLCVQMPRGIDPFDPEASMSLPVSIGAGAGRAFNQPTVSPCQGSWGSPKLFVMAGGMQRSRVRQDGFLLPVLGAGKGFECVGSRYRTVAAISVPPSAPDLKCSF